MNDFDKGSHKIKRLSDSSDHALWKVRPEAACTEKNCERAPGELAEEICESDYKRRQRLASSVIITALSDSTLRIIHSVKGSPLEMLKKLDARYACEGVAFRITRMPDLITMEH